MSDHDLADRAKTTKKHQDSLNSAKTEEDWLNTSSANSKPLTDQLASTGDTGTTNHYPVHTKTGAMNLTPRTILSLQRTVGNKAVHRMLSYNEDRFASPDLSDVQLKRMDTQRLASVPTHTTSSYVIQRDPAQKGLADAAEKASKGATKSSAPLKQGDVPLRRLPDAPIFFDLASINTGMENLYVSMGEASTLSKEIGVDVEYLAWAGSSGAKQAVEEAKSKQAELFRKLKTNEKLREKVSDYTDYVGEGGKVFDAAGEYDEALHGALAAFYALEGAVNSEDILKAEEETETADAEKKKIEAEIKEAQRIAGAAVDITASLVQQKWTDAASGLGKFLGKELVNMAIDAAYSSELQEASDKLQKAKTRLGSLKNKGAALAIKEKAELLQKANKEADRKKAVLTRTITEANTKRTALTDELDRMGFGAISDAIFMRESMLEASGRAAGNLNTYTAKVADIGTRAEKLKDLNGAFAELLSSPGGENFIKDELVRESVHEIAIGNKLSLEKIEKWATEAEPENIERIKTELQKAEFMDDANVLIKWFDELLGI